MDICGKLRQQGAEFPRPVRANGEARLTDGGAGAIAAVRACSACAGDYEDPDRTAWIPDDADASECEDALGPAAEEFPAEES